MRVLHVMPLALALAVTACDVREVLESQPRIRNQPPANCTSEALDRCMPPTTSPCPDGAEPVIDYSSDCCQVFSCQPVCVAPQPCPVRPAPTCPAGTTLWIGTALDDCCPTYQCEPDIDCDPTRAAACPAGFPYCGPDVAPIAVGKTADCCPIYQCPCATAAGEILSDPAYCGCTYPVCTPGEQLECLGGDVCGYPCECRAVASDCLTDADCPQYDCGPGTDCGVQLWCDTSMCLPPPGCDPATGLGCTSACGGLCVGNAIAGCKADVECPTGQRCEIMCSGWACAPEPNGPQCGCPPELRGCWCEADGSCHGEECFGTCMPV